MSINRRNSSRASIAIRGSSWSVNCWQMCGLNIHSGIASCRPSGNLTIRIAEPILRK